MDGLEHAMMLLRRWRMMHNCTVRSYTEMNSLHMMTDEFLSSHCGETEPLDRFDAPARIAYRERVEQCFTRTFKES